jgi:hypothetical protein
MRATLPLRARSMLPWALDRLVPDAAARFALPSVAAGRFAWRPEPLRRPPTRTSGEGRVFRPCLAPATRDPRPAPKGGRSGPRWLRQLPKETPRPHPSRATRGMPVDLPREEAPPRRVPHPKARTFRRRRDASPKRLVRDPARAPKSGVRWFELVLAILPRSPAYVMVRPLAARARTRRCMRLRATRAHPEVLRRTPLRASRRSAWRGEPWASPGGVPLAAHGSGNSSKLERRLGPDSHRVHRDGRDSIRRRSPSPDPKIGMTGAEAPWVRSVRTSHLGWQSVASTEVLVPRGTAVLLGQARPESILLPLRRRRSASRNPDRRDPDGR